MKKNPAGRWLYRFVSATVVATFVFTQLSIPAAQANAVFTFGNTGLTWSVSNASSIIEATTSSPNHGDAYDGAFATRICNAAPCTTTSGNYSQYSTSGSAYNAGTQSVVGTDVTTFLSNTLTVQSSYKFSSTLLAGRQLIKLSNTSGNSISTSIMSQTNLGSDGSSNVKYSSNNTTLRRDTSFPDTTAFWTITSDSSSTDPLASGSDPLVSNVWGTANATIAPTVNMSGDNLVSLYNVTLPANSTRYLMIVFGVASIAVTGNAATNRLGDAFSAVTTHLDSFEKLPNDLKSDLDANILSNILNWVTSSGPQIPQLATPGSVTATATADTLKSIDVTWGAVSNVSSYTAKVYNSSNQLQATIANLSGTSAQITTANFAGIADKTSYRVTVTAIGDGTNYLSSPESTQANVTTNGVANAPTINSITSDDSQLTINFTAGANGGLAISNYKYSLNNASYITPANPVTSSPLVITGLTNGTAYSVKLRAVNSAGDSAESSAVSQTPRKTLTQPTVTANPTSDVAKSIDVSWSAITDVTSYTLKLYSAADALLRTITAVAANSTTRVITATDYPQLVDGASYKVSVQAIGNNIATLSGLESTKTPVAILGGPDAPANPTLSTAGLADGQLKLSWTGVTNETTYEYRFALADVGAWSNWVEVNNDEEVTFGSLINGRRYIAQVRTKNSIGTSTPVTTATSVLTLGTPPVGLTEPTNTSVTPADGRLTIRFTAPSAATQNDAITNFQYSLDGSVTWISVALNAANLTTVSSGVFDLVVAGLTNGTVYNVAVRAVNASGPGSGATIGQATPGKGPGIPSNISVTPGANQLSVALTAPTDTGGLPLNYEYRIREGVLSGGVPSYYPAGPQTNIAPSTITAGGWTMCWSSDYRASVPLTTLQNACTGKYLLYAGGPKPLGTNYRSIAAGERDSIFKPTGSNQTTLNNGVYWYYNVNASIGFAPTATIQQSSADVFDRASNLRLSWHARSGNINGGWRAGSQTGLNSSTTWTRSIYQATPAAQNDDAGWSDWNDAGSSAPFTVGSIQNDRTYTVQVRAKNAAGTGTAAAAVSINAQIAANPTITTQPQNQGLTEGQAGGVTLGVVATAEQGATLSYQWYKNNEVINGATSATYAQAGNVANSMAGNYKVRVTSTITPAGGTQTTAYTDSQVATVTINGPLNMGNEAVGDGTVNSTYAHQLTASGGTTPITWSLAPGAALPVGLSLTPEGRIIGTPTLSTAQAIASGGGANAAAAAAAIRPGSISFNGSSSALSVAASADWAPGTGDFTVEWFQYQTDSRTAPKVFWLGTLNQDAFGVSLESNQFFYFRGGTGVSLGNLGTYKNQWVHFALTRSGSTVRAFKNGVLLGSTSDTTNLNVTNSPLSIGNRGAGSPNDAFFGGQLTNLHFIKGTAKYTSNFTVSTTTSATANTKLLLQANAAGSFLTDSSGTGKAVTNNGASFSVDSPNSGSASNDTLKNAGFTSPLVTDATLGWKQEVRSGGNAVIAGGSLTFSYGASACTAQATARMGEVRQIVTVSTPGTVTFSVDVDARLWNRIGAAYSNPCHDPYQVQLAAATGGLGDSTRIFSTQSLAQLNDANVNDGKTLQRITVSVTTTTANEQVTIKLFGLDAGYWGGNYGPRFSNAQLVVPGGGQASAGTTVIATDANGRTVSRTFNIEVAPELVLATTTLGSAAIGTAYNQTLIATGGSGTNTWSAVGNLPNGLTLNTGTGAISGTPAAGAQSSSFTIRVTDSNGAVKTQALSITISNALPGAPTGLTMGTSGDALVPLTWTPPAESGGSAITEYVVSFTAQKGTDPDDTNDIHAGSVTVNATGLSFPYDLTGLRNGRSYTITVAAKNSSTLSNASAAVTAKPRAAAATPQQVAAGLGNGGITVRWREPQRKGGGPVSGWDVQCQKSGANTWSAVSTAVVNESANGEFSVVANTLELGSEYRCQVRAKTQIREIDNSNTIVEGEWSEQTGALVLATSPGSPVNLASLAPTNNSGVFAGRVTASWDKPANNGGAVITSYVATIVRNPGANNEIRRSCSVARPSNADQAATFDALTSHSCVIVGVPRRGTFTYEVVAINGFGSSPEATASLVIAGRTQTLTKATPANRPLGSADFAISATVDSGLPLQFSSTTLSICTITERGMVRMIAAGLCTVNINQNGNDAQGNETEWAALVQDSVSFTVQLIAPGVVRFDEITSGNQQLEISWFASTGSGGAPTSYLVQVSSDNGANWSNAVETDAAQTAARTRIITGLTNGTAYKVRVASKNAGGTSEYVVAAGTYTPFTVPSTPTIGAVTIANQTGTASVTWSAPANNGSAITGYVVTATLVADANNPAGSATTASCSVGGSATSCTIAGLSNKVSYDFALKARNLAGESVASTAVREEIGGLPQTISLSPAPASSGYTVGDQNLQLQASSSSGLALNYASTTANVCTVSTSGSVAFVAAGSCSITISQTGASSRFLAATDVTIALTVAGARPSSPALTSVTSSDNGAVVSWSVPARIGSELTGYTVTATAANATVITKTVNGATTTVTFGTADGLVKGSDYSYTVIATNANGNSAASSAMQGRWTTKPSAPIILSVTPSGTDGRAATVTWDHPVDDGGVFDNRFIATATSAGLADISCTRRSAGVVNQQFSCLLTGMRAGAVYEVQIVARNTRGTSDPSAAIQVTPGLAQVITISPTGTISKTIADADFRIVTSIDSGNSPIFSSSNNAICTVDATGLVQIKANGQCVITVSHPGATAQDESAYKAATAVTLTINVSATAPSAPVITSVAPGNLQAVITFSAPGNTGGADIQSYTATTNTGEFCTVNAPALSCTITGLTNGTSYTVSVVATNSAANSAASAAVSVTPYTRATAPLPLLATAGNKSVALSWSVPAELGGGTMVRYEILGRAAGAATYLLVHTTADATITSFNVTAIDGVNLANGTSYEFQVRAITLVANAEVQGITDAIAATTFSGPSVPRSVNLTAGFNASPSVIISWRAPETTGGAAITSYTVTLTPGGATCTTATTSCEITGLTAATNYSAVVIATTSVTSSASTAPVSITTIDRPAAASINAVVANNDAASATVSFNAAATDGGTAITSYLVQAFIGANATAFSCVVVPTGAGPFSCTVTGLSYKTDYTFKVTARNLVGSSAASAASSVITLIRSQEITFTAPADISFATRSIALTGSASSGLELSYTSSTTDICTVADGVVSILKAGSCTITAAQSGAGSAFSEAVAVSRTFTVTAITPDAPTLGSVTPGAAALTVSFTAVTNLGGSTSDGYVVSWARNPDFSDEQSAVVAANATSYQISNLTANAIYSVRVKVITAAVADGSAWSNVLQGSTFGAPSAPTSVSAAAGVNGTPTPGAVTVTWVAAASSGGTPITGYRAIAMEGVGVPAAGKTCITAGSSCVITGLDGARFYFFEVVAINAVGESEPGVDETEIRPGATQEITATDITTEVRKKRISLGAFSSSGLPLGYAVVSQTKADASRAGNVCAVDAAGVVTLGAVGSCVIEITQAGLDANGNASAYLPATAVQVTVTVAVSDPSNAKNLIITSADRSLEITWVGPDEDGGRPIVGYEVSWFRKDQPQPNDAAFEAAKSENNVTTAADYGRVEVVSESRTITGLINGRLYTIIIRPINSGDEQGRRKGPTS